MPSGGGSHRSGSIVVLSAILVTMLIVVAGVTINLTQLAVAKSEIRMASDAAAKAGAVVLGQTQNQNEARRVAKQIAAGHTVSGSRLRLRNADIQMGNSVANADGSFTFRLNQLPINSVRVDAKLGDGSAAGGGDYFLSHLSPDSFQLQYQSIATRVDHDVCLVIDRSGSMAWDLSGDEWSYPNADPNETRSIMQQYFELPHPTDSRWAALTRSTEMFLDEVDELPVEAQVGLVSYSSNFIFGVYESEASTIESELTTDHETLQEAVEAIGQRELIGNTNIAAGMQDAFQVLTDEDARITAKATMIVLTDGRGNQGTDPVAVARAAAEANITIHAITFGAQADQVQMAEVAAAGGGQHHHAPDDESLGEVFRKLAQTLPAVLTN